MKADKKLGDYQFVQVNSNMTIFKVCTVFYSQNIHEQDFDSKMRDKVRSKLKKRKANDDDDDDDGDETKRKEQSAMRLVTIQSVHMDPT